jgi:hypothetical protein
MQLRGEIASGRWWRKSSMGHRLTWVHKWPDLCTFGEDEQTSHMARWPTFWLMSQLMSFYSLEICHRSLSAFCSSRGPNPKHCSCNILLLLTWSIRWVRTISLTLTKKLAQEGHLLYKQCFCDFLLLFFLYTCCTTVLFFNTCLSFTQASSPLI